MDDIKVNDGLLLRLWALLFSRKKTKGRHADFTRAAQMGRRVIAVNSGERVIVSSPASRHHENPFPPPSTSRPAPTKPQKIIK